MNLEILDHVDPAALDYTDWVRVGMAIKTEGGTCDLWDEWSRRDTGRYKAGECYRKWEGFNGSSNPVTAGTLVELAKQQGYVPPARLGKAFEWDDEIRDDKDDLRIIDAAWVEDSEVNEPAPEDWNPVKELSDYLSALFESNEYVGYCSECWEKDGRYLPKKGSWTRKAGELLHELARCNGDICAVIGDYDQAAGAWIRFNPLDGHGVKDENVTSYRFALIESDTLTIEKQSAIYRELELPIAALVHSGKKSLHAIVRIDATSREEYRERVNFLHQVCQKNGLQIDVQNKNPSRLSRMPGIMRGGHKQWLVGLRQGKPTYDAWRNWIEEVNDSLPDIETLSSVWDSLPPLAPPLIDGLLRAGHKMLLAGPSKAGKSYILLQMAMAIAEGRNWLGWTCAQGKVLYVNLELDRASCLHRLKTLYQAHGWQPEHISNIDIWNLRGKAVPMDVLAPKLIRRAVSRGYRAVIIDPIYKVITGDENAADKMSHFCNQFDRVCAELGSAVIYCHHHSKGAQGQKASRDRSSGSGVFARDPDAILDLIELYVEPARRKQLENREVCNAISAVLDVAVPDWRDSISQDDAVVAKVLVEQAFKLVSQSCRDVLSLAIQDAQARAQNQSGWRMEATLREFPPFEPRRFWFRYPIHVADIEDMLLDAKADGEEAPWTREYKERQAAKKDRKTSNKEKLATAVSATSFGSDEPVMIGDVAEYCAVDVKTIKRWIAETSDYVLVENQILTRTAAKRQELDQAIKVAADLSGVVKLVDVAARLKQCEKNVRIRIKDSGKYEVLDGCVFEKGS